ncbi:Clavaminate synthase-like protein [Leucogyrophana mollusca]|uniref:Clavaminate synthase-like protein n=1 Tax=Leucogyrophana mollusca TaxID=85980 RepID=A0ACB8BU28_9AGAM|nr:Clavaminate synthase-like protein [Leucogyrophana mollusca]
MPSLTLPQSPRYVTAPPTGEILDYANLAIIDMTKARTAEGRAVLAVEVRDALLTHGFFYVVNHGYTQPQTERIFDIADVPLSGVNDEEKRVYAGNINRHISNVSHPQALRPFIPEVDAFIRHNHFNILEPLLKLVALTLELPEDTLSNMHSFDGSNISYFMTSCVHFHNLTLYNSFTRSEEDELKTKNVWLKGHKDTGSLTLLWSQPVAALQILTKDGWRWIRHIENALIVNTGDSLEFLTGGYIKGTIHRVVQPPADQRGYARLSVIYFCTPDEEIKLIPLTESPVLQRVGIERQCEDSQAPTAKEWRVARTRAYGQGQLRKSKEENIEEEICHGLVVKHYN